MRSRSAGQLLTVSKNTPTHSIHERAWKAAAFAVDVSPLEHILEIDAERRLALVEGQVRMGELCRATLAQRLLPAVVPEYRDFTVAGLINGEGIQSSSHRYGVFSHTLCALEVVLGDGSVVEASEQQHADLFAALPRTLGTLGIVTAASVSLIPAGPFVRSRYQRFTAIERFVEALRDSLEQTTYVEGVVFAPDCCVLVTAEFADRPDGLPLVPQMEPGRPYYYQHVRAAAEGRAPDEDAMATLDYLARSERGTWWAAECLADMPAITGTYLGRRWIDLRDEASAGAARDRFGPGKGGVLERERSYVLQDIGFRIERLAEALHWVERNLALYPVWTCPIHLRPFEFERFDTHYLVDVGLYGEPGVRSYEPMRLMRELQRMSDAPSLWGVSYLTREELRSQRVLDFEEYDRVRREYAAEGALPAAEDKVVWVDPERRVSGKPSLWRLRLAYGPRWFANPEALLVLLLGKWANFVWLVFRAAARVWFRGASA